MKRSLPKDVTEQEMLDPDVRFLLANERTLLAWVRTSLALFAGGLALTQIGNHATSKSIIGIVIIAMGAVMTFVGLLRYRAADYAIRHGRLPAAGKGPQLQVAGVIVMAVVLIIIELLSIKKY